MEGRTFITDDWEGFHRRIPENQPFTGKDLTFPIEQDNSNIRHYLARFRPPHQGRLKMLDHGRSVPAASPPSARS
jgi:IS1 family transposase